MFCSGEMVVKGRTGARVLRRFLTSCLFQKMPASASSVCMPRGCALQIKVITGTHVASKIQFVGIRRTGMQVQSDICILTFCYFKSSRLIFLHENLAQIITIPSTKVLLFLACKCSNVIRLNGCLSRNIKILVPLMTSV